MYNFFDLFGIEIFSIGFKSSLKEFGFSSKRSGAIVILFLFLFGIFLSLFCKIISLLLLIKLSLIIFWLSILYKLLSFRFGFISILLSFGKSYSLSFVIAMVILFLNFGFLILSLFFCINSFIWLDILLTILLALDFSLILLILSNLPPNEFILDLILNRFLFASVFNLVCCSILSLLSFEELLEISELSFWILLTLEILILLLFCSKLEFKILSFDNEFLPEFDNFIFTTFEGLFWKSITLILLALISLVWENSFNI